MIVTRGPFGWSIRVAARLEGERWTHTKWMQYEGLSMAELLDVVEQSATKTGS